jgi:cytochrome d ubiquinol oxidase subunit II
VHLYEVPLIFVLAGLVLYAVLAGADFGAGFWQLLAGPGERGAPIRDHAHEAMAPVWEANHVWLIFVLTVTWTAYPSAFGAIASTLCVPLFIAGLGIVMRGAAYALRAGTSSVREQDRVDLVFALSSVLTPFALGTVIGAIAARRVPVGNASGDLLSSWTGATPLLIGALAVANSAYIAAVFLAADAKRTGRSRELQDALRTRAVIAGLIAGAVALAGLIVVQSDAHFLYTRLLQGGALAAVIVSALAGLATLALVFVRRFELARYSAALAVAGIIAGWALAQRPLLLPGLTVHQAAAPHDTIVVVVVAVLAGAVILFPSLALLFRLVLGGTFTGGYGTGAPPAAAPGPVVVARASATGLLGRAAVALLIGGLGFLTIADAGWAHAIGVVCLLGFVVTGFAAVGPTELAQQGDSG